VFVAVVEVAPVARPVRPRPADRDPAERRLSGRPSARRPRRRKVAEPAEPAESPADVEVISEGHHDHPSGGLPVSVLIGLALLPFVIPLLWLLAPVAVGQGPALSVAAPIALAVAASALCLAVVYTVDWTPPTRVRGVLILLAVAAFAGVGLFLLKKEHIDRVKRAVGVEPEWVWIREAEEKYRVEMPSPAPNGKMATDPALPPGWNLVAHRVTVEEKTFVVGSTIDPNRNRPEEVAFDHLKRAVEANTGGVVRRDVADQSRAARGRQWEITLPDGSSRDIRVYRKHGRVYYLGVEGPNLVPNEPDVWRFFNSFQVDP
jgi:hypothetical protein